MTPTRMGRLAGSWGLMGILLLGACGNDTLGPDNDLLSDALSLTDLTKTPVADPADGSRIVGLLVDVDVVNTAFFPIDRPFRMTWALRENDATFASAATVISTGLDAGERTRVHLDIRFPSRAHLNGVTDAIFFDLISQ